VAREAKLGYGLMLFRCRLGSGGIAENKGVSNSTTVRTQLAFQREFMLIVATVSSSAIAAGGVMNNSGLLYAAHRPLIRNSS